MGRIRSVNPQSSSGEHTVSLQPSVGIRARFSGVAAEVLQARQILIPGLAHAWLGPSNA
jgi:hypothetical protein